MPGMVRYWLVALTVVLTLAMPRGSNAVDFAPPSAYPAGTSPSLIVVGDFNGDSKPDLAVVNSSNDISILINHGNGTFKAAVNSSAGTSPQGMAAGDFNRDGKLDLVVVNRGNASSGLAGVAFLLLGNGDGTLQPPVQIAADPSPLSVAVADFNGDSIPDLVLGDGSNGTLTILLGKGDGSFTAHTTVSLGSSGSVAALIVNDFNGDHKQDVVAALTIGQVVMLLGNGDGSFAAPTAVAAAGSSPHMLTGDFNGDGKLDLVLRVETPHPAPCRRPPIVCFATDQVIILRGKGDGTFNPGTTVFSAINISPGNLAAGDFNADSKTDLVVPRLGSGLSYLGLGDGTFLATPPPLWTGLGGFVIAADLNGDNLPDLAVVGSAHDVDVFLNTSANSGADLAVTEPAQANATIGGDNLTYRATVLNTGPQDATGVTLKENLPSALTLVSVQPSQGTCSGTTTISCVLGAMPDVSSSTVDFTVKATKPGSASDSVQVTATQPDLNSKNNSASMTVTAVLPADLAVSETASETVAKIGDNVTFTVVVTNHGPATAPNVSLTDNLSDALPVTSLTISQGNCAPPIVCAIGTLAPGASATLKFVVTTATAELLASNAGTGSDQPDLLPDNNNTSVSVAVNPADLLVTQSASATSVTTGAQVTVTLSVTNKGPQAASNVILTDLLQGGGTPSSATTTQGSCSAPLGGQITCALGSLAASATATITVPINFTEAGQWTNSANISATEPDPDSTNNSANLNIEVSTAPDFMVSPASSSLTMKRGGTGSDVLTFSSLGGFSGAVSLACSVSGPAPTPSCSIAPTSVTLGATPATATLTLTTVSAMLVPAQRHEVKGPFYALWLPLPGIAFIGIGFASGKSRRRRLLVGLLCSMTLAVIALQAACGGGGSSTPPPATPKSYTVTVTMSAGAISKSTVINLTVN